MNGAKLTGCKRMENLKCMASLLHLMCKIIAGSINV